MTQIEKITKKAKEEILGKHYELSFSFINKSEIKKLNKKYRGKNEATDILSFPLEKTAGEILICKEMTKEKAPKFEKTFNEYLLFLVIHGLLHLKGLKHGAKMEKYENWYYSRYRCRHV
jgi:probable rRNA maturation factor